MTAINCIHRRNPMGGFLTSHRRFCARAGCDEDATHHINLEHWCGNVCKEHCDALKKASPGEVTDTIYIDERDYR